MLASRKAFVLRRFAAADIIGTIASVVNHIHVGLDCLTGRTVSERTERELNFLAF
jgi:hypothetical protein